MRIGILGSGLMGGKLGTLFARAGHEVVFSYSRSRKKLETLARGAGNGARAGTPREVTEQSDIVFTIVGFPSDVREVYFGPQADNPDIEDFAGYVEIFAAVRFGDDLHFLGDAAGIHREIELQTLPLEIPNSIEIDVTNLGLNEAVYVRDVAQACDASAGPGPVPWPSGARWSAST